MKNNIRLAYILSFISELYFPISVWLFYYLRYLDFSQIGILTAVKLLSSILFEVPTGVFADKAGRKRAIVISFFLYGLVMFGFAGGSVFWMFIVLDIFKALANAFYSGSMEALVYDSLKEDGEEESYDKVVSNMESIAWVGLFVSSVLGGFLYFFWFRSPYVIQGSLYIVSGFIALGLVEPKIDSKKYSWKEAWKGNTAGISELFANNKVAQMTVVFVILGAGYFIASEMMGISQAREYGMDSRWAGILFGVGYIVSAMFSQFYPILRKLFGARKLLYVVAAVLIGSFLLARWVGVIVGSILIVSRISSSTTFRNTRSGVINKLIGSKSRATSISTLVLLSQLPMAIMAYFLGDYIDKHSPNMLAWLVGWVMIGALIIQWVYFRSRIKYEPNNAMVRNSN
ncbi:MFS transporter [Candidatus Shapirobacteria bacterium]|nr:MFS transporter [Candidatus Shapirobacteria bacterium]